METSGPKQNPARRGRCRFEKREYYSRPWCPDIAHRPPGRWVGVVGAGCSEPGVRRLGGCLTQAPIESLKVIYSKKSDRATRAPGSEIGPTGSSKDPPR